MQGQLKIALGLGTALLAAGALTSCSKSGSGGGAAQAFNEAPSSTAYTITPGQYETTVKLTSGSVEGFPPEVQQRIQQMQNNPRTQRACVPIGFSLESASLKNMRFTLPQDMGGCNIGDITQEGGAIRGALSCEIKNLPQRSPDAPRAVTVNANWNGTYTGDTWTATFHMEASEPGGNRRGSGDIEISSRRVGDCPAGANPFGPSMSPPPSMNTMSGNSSDEMGGNMSGGPVGDGNMSGGNMGGSSKPTDGNNM